MAAKILDAYVNGMKLKRCRFGGVDEVDALKHMEALAMRYEQVVAQLVQRAAALEQENQGYYSQLVQMQQSVDALRAENDQLRRRADAAGLSAWGSGEAVATEMTQRQILQELRTMSRAYR